MPPVPRLSTSVRKRRRRRKPRAKKVAGELSILEQERIGCSLSAWQGKPGNCQWCNSEITSVRRRTWCSDACGRVYQRNHIWRFARAAAKRRAKYFCERPRCSAQRRDCEVNHRTAREGGGYGPGCHHHLLPDNDDRGGLEVLCRAHHREVTTAQAKLRALRRRTAREAAAAETSPTEVSSPPTAP